MPVLLGTSFCKYCGFCVRSLSGILWPKDQNMTNMICNEVLVSRADIVSLCKHLAVGVMHIPGMPNMTTKRS